MQRSQKHRHSVLESTVLCTCRKIIILEINSGNVLRAIVVKNTFCAGHTAPKHHWGTTLKEEC